MVYELRGVCVCVCAQNPFRKYARSNYFNSKTKTLFVFFFSRVDIDDTKEMMSKSAGVSLNQGRGTKLPVSHCMLHHQFHLRMFLIKDLNDYHSTVAVSKKALVRLFEL